VTSETPAFSKHVFETLVHCSFKEKILSNGVDSWIYTWFVWKHIKNST